MRARGGSRGGRVAGPGVQYRGRGGSRGQGGVCEGRGGSRGWGRVLGGVGAGVHPGEGVHPGVSGCIQRPDKRARVNPALHEKGQGVQVKGRSLFTTSFG